MESIKVPLIEENHGGGDILMKDMIFKDTSMPDSLNQKAGLRDGALSILVGIAARTSIDTGRPIKISELCDITQK